ncbi:MAG: PEP-CTERM sorting domain-containing protein [Akkermansiaceae bacterium]|nr:PEP-CTERM sorting domain-containing protein [Akkermansiaceae bacterium]
MKRAIAIMSILAGLSGAAGAETLWVYGVNEQQGWYDADKENSTTDLNKCWAAVSANLINWWQNQYVIPAMTMNGKIIPDEDGVWEKYRTCATTNMGDASIGVDWWWTGDAYKIYLQTGGANLGPDTPFIQDGKEYSAAYYVYNVPREYSYSNYVETVSVSSIDLSTYLYDAMSDYDKHRLGFGINLGGSSGHGVTLWGADFGADMTLQAVYITDSDDITEGGGDFDLKRFEVYRENGEYYLKDYWSSTNKIDSLTVLDASATDSWKLERIYIDLPTPLSAVPEPTTATLSILALAALSARRRRN